MAADSRLDFCLCNCCRGIEPAKDKNTGTETEIVSPPIEKKEEKEAKKVTPLPKKKEETHSLTKEKKTEAQDIKPKTDAKEIPEKKPEAIKKDEQLSKEAHQQQMRELQKHEETPKKEVKPPPVKTATLLDLPLELRKSYNSRMQRIQIILPKALPLPRFQVKGYINFNLFIDDRGRLSIQTFNDDMLNVIPARLKRRVQGIIKNKMNRIFLDPPKNKAGETVQVSNWRVTFKVGKFFNKIILTKQ